MESLLNVWQFKSQTLLAVDNLEEQTEDEGCHAEAGQHDEGGGIVELGGVGDSWVGGIEHLADEQWEQPQANMSVPAQRAALCSPSTQ